MTAASPWPPLREQAATELQALVRNEHDAVIVSEQETETTPTTYDHTRARGPLRALARRLGIIKLHRFPNLRFVRFTTSKDQNTLYAECVGSTAWNGFIEVTPETDSRLRALGWLSPQDPGYLDSSFGPGAPMYRLSTPDTDIDHLADLAIESLALLGLTPHSPITVETPQRPSRSSRWTHSAMSATTQGVHPPRPAVAAATAGALSVPVNLAAFRLGLRVQASSGRRIRAAVTAMTGQDPRLAAAASRRRDGSGRTRLVLAFAAGALIGMIGLGGAEFRLPLLIGIFGFAALKAVIVNKAMSLIVVLTALPARLLAGRQQRRSTGLGERSSLPAGHTN
jgi:hypothetical protein